MQMKTERIHMHTNCFYWQQFEQSFSNILYAIKWWSSTRPLLLTTELFKEAPSISDHDHLFTCGILQTAVFGAFTHLPINVLLRPNLFE